MAVYSSTDLLDILRRVNLPETIKKIFRDIIDSVSGGIDTTSSTAELNILTGVTSSAAELNILDGVTATKDEINMAADRNIRTQTLTVSGPITEFVQSVELDHTTVAIAATIASAYYRGLLVIKSITEPGAGQDHTVTIAAGTFNGTNKIATFADINDTLVVYFDSAGNGTILANIGSVALSG